MMGRTNKRDEKVEQAWTAICIFRCHVDWVWATATCPDLERLSYLDK